MTKLNPETVSLANDVRRLKGDVMRWQCELACGDIRRTTLQGIAADAADRFEVCLRALLGHYLTTCKIDYNDNLGNVVKHEELGGLTLGEVTESFKRLNAELTRCCRGRSDRAARLLASRRLLTPDDMSNLGEITRMRNDLHHRRHVFARDESTLTCNARDILSRVSHALESPLFVVAPPDD